MANAHHNTSSPNCTPTVPRSRWPWVLCLLAVAGTSSAADAPQARGLLAQVGISKGICAVPNCGSGELALEIAKESEFLVPTFDVDPGKISAALARAQRAGLDGSRLVLERLTSDRLPSADNFVDLVDKAGVNATCRVGPLVGKNAQADDTASLDFLRWQWFPTDACLP